MRARSRTSASRISSQLSQLIGINQVTTENNGLVHHHDLRAVAGLRRTSFQMTTGTVGGVTHFFLGGTDVTDRLTTGGGELGGYLTARDQDIPKALASLDQLAYGVSTEVNAQNKLRQRPERKPRWEYLCAPAQVAGSAAAMSVVMTDPNRIAAAALGTGRATIRMPWRWPTWPAKAIQRF